MSGYADYSDAYVGVSIAPPAKRGRDDTGPASDDEWHPPCADRWAVPVRTVDNRDDNRERVQQWGKPQHTGSTAQNANHIKGSESANRSDTVQNNADTWQSSNAGDSYSARGTVSGGVRANAAVYGQATSWNSNKAPSPLDQVSTYLKTMHGGSTHMLYTIKEEGEKFQEVVVRSMGKKYKNPGHCLNALLKGDHPNHDDYRITWMLALSLNRWAQFYQFCTDPDRSSSSPLFERVHLNRNKHVPLLPVSGSKLQCGVRAMSLSDIRAMTEPTLDKPVRLPIENNDDITLGIEFEEWVGEHLRFDALETFFCHPHLPLTCTSDGLLGNSVVEVKASKDVRRHMPQLLAEMVLSNRPLEFIVLRKDLNPDITLQWFREHIEKQDKSELIKFICRVKINPRDVFGPHEWKYPFLQVWNALSCFRYRCEIDVVIQDTLFGLPNDAEGVRFLAQYYGIPEMCQKLYKFIIESNAWITCAK